MSWKCMAGSGCVGKVGVPPAVGTGGPVASSSQKAGFALLAALAACWAMSAKADNKTIDYNAINACFENNEIATDFCAHPYCPDRS
jgi:hypothetical protein